MTAVIAVLALLSPVVSPAPDGGPIYQGPTQEALAVSVPPMVLIEGEWVPETLDLPWFMCIHSREASGWHNHIDGGLQIIPPTWKAQGGLEYAPHAGDATVVQQLDVGRNVLTSGGETQWSTWRWCA